MRMCHLEERLASTERFIHALGQEMLPALQAAVDEQAAMLASVAASFGTFVDDHQQQTTAMRVKITATAETIEGVHTVLKQLISKAQAGEEWKQGDDGQPD